MKKLLLIGGGGHCRSVLDSVRRIGAWDEIGIIDNKQREAVSGIPIVGADEDMEALWTKGWREAFVSIGSIGIEDAVLRRMRYQDAKRIGFSFPYIVDPTAVIAEDVNINEGVYVGKQAVINAGAHIEECAIINTGAVLEHGCQIGGFCHISTGAILCGSVCVGEQTHVGAGAVVRQGLTIGRNALIGIGSVVVKDIPDAVKAYGNPCKEVE